MIDIIGREYPRGSFSHAFAFFHLDFSFPRRGPALCPRNLSFLSFFFSFFFFLYFSLCLYFSLHLCFPPIYSASVSFFQFLFLVPPLRLAAGGRPSLPSLSFTPPSKPGKPPGAHGGGDGVAGREANNEAAGLGVIHEAFVLTARSDREHLDAVDRCLLRWFGCECLIR